MIKKNQKGFGIIEALIIAAVIAIAAFGGWYAVKHSHNAATNTSNALADQSYQGNGYTLKYPADWKFVSKNATYATDEFLPTANYPSNNAYILNMMHDTSTMTAENYGNDAYKTKISPVVGKDTTTINGYDTFTVNFKPIEASAALAHDIYIIHKGVVVEFIYYEDASSYVNTYKSIINSIKFTN